MFPGHSAHFPDLSFTGSVWFLLGRDSCGPFTSFFWNSLECKHHGSGTRSLKPGTDMFLEPFEKHKEIQDLYTFELEAERKSFNAKGVAKILAI